MRKSLEIEVIVTDLSQQKWKKWIAWLSQQKKPNNVSILQFVCVNQAGWEAFSF